MVPFASFGHEVSLESGREVNAVTRDNHVVHASKKAGRYAALTIPTRSRWLMKSMWKSIWLVAIAGTLGVLGSLGSAVAAPPTERSTNQERFRALLTRQSRVERPAAARAAVRMQVRGSPIPTRLPE